VDNGSAYAEINGKKVMEYSEQQVTVTCWPRRARLT
jgi:hypothetical protein